jgi:dolichol-phosphate mannosyltransferase
VLGVTGLVVSFLALAGLAYLTWRALAIGVPFDGYGTLLGITVLGFGFTAAALGLIGEYIALIYEEVKRRPNFIVRKTIGFD